MTVCCQCGRKYWPGKKECPGAYDSDGCNHVPCENCQHYVDEKEKEYDRPKRDRRTVGKQEKRT